VTRSSDLVPYLQRSASAGQGVNFRQGVVVAWNQATAENIIQLGNTLVTNASVLNTSEASLLAPGDVVMLLMSGSTCAVLGRMTFPGTPAAASALAAVRTAGDTVGVLESTSSTSFGDLSTVGPGVTIPVGQTGRALVTIGANMRFDAARGSAVNTAGASMSFAITGANTQAATADRALLGSIRYDSLQAGGFDTTVAGFLDASKQVLVTGLTPGDTTFTAKYRAVTSGSAQFEDRVITVLAL
jgi:hypothetical protein